MPGRDLRELEEAIGHRFAERSLLELALTHSSSTGADALDNERLEFLGDAVLGLAVTEHLYRCFTRCSEGVLTRIKSAVVSAPALARRARALSLETYAKLGRGMPGPANLSDAVLANLFEGLVAALYLDAGYDAAARFVMDQLADEIDEAAERGDGNHKAALQELSTRRFGELPRYRLASSTGPDHGRVFEVEVVLAGRTFPSARGRTKKEAEQAAALIAIEAIAAEPPPEA
jgi:ribonuclease-3